jgi:hypothetical protein
METNPVVFRDLTYIFHSGWHCASLPEGHRSENCYWWWRRWHSLPEWSVKASSAR